MIRLFSAVVLVVTTLWSIARGNDHHQQRACKAPTNWFIAAEAPDYNNRVVSDFLNNIKSIRAPGTAYATFDWDNTCMYGDITYTSVIYQLEQLNFRIPPSQFKQAFAVGYTYDNGDACFAQGINTVIGQDVAKNNVTMAQIIESMSQDYQVLYDLYIAPYYKLKPGTAPSLASAKETEVYNNFRAKVGFYAWGLESSYGTNDELPCAMRTSMSSLAPLLVGMTETEIRTLVRESLRWNLNAKLDTPSYTSTGSLAVYGEHATGLRVFNGQETTMRALRQQGVEVYVISAAPQEYVEEVTMLRGLGFVVPPSNVYGVRFAYKNNKFTGQLIENYPITWGPGKAEIITKWIQPKHKGAAPIYASGDSNGDVYMLDQVRDGIVHINNRLKSNVEKIQAYYEKACLYFNRIEPETNNRYLLQGQDKEMGTWITSGFTTKNGVDYKSGAIANDACVAYKFL